MLWRGQPVIRERYVIVDGGRYAVPLPRQHFEEITPDKHALMPLTISPWQHTVGKLVHGIGLGGHDYDQGLGRSGVTVE